MKKVLIIGGTGTISMPITQKLAADPEVELYVLNRGTNNADLPESVNYIKGNIQEVATTKETLKDYSFDSVINFIVWNDKDATNNVEIFNGKTKQFVYISTVCVLDNAICNVDETSPVGNKYSDYGQGKARAEAVFQKAQAELGFPITIVRPTQTYSDHRIPLSVKGKGCWPVVSRMLRGKQVIVHGDGQSLWASTHATDFAEYFYSIVADETTIGEIYHIMNPEPHTWDMIYQSLAKLLNVEYRPVYIGTDLLKASKTYDLNSSIQGDKRWSKIFDISKIQARNPELEFKISYEEGLEMYLEFMENHPEQKIEEPEFDQWCDETIARYEEMMATFTKDI